MAEELLKEELKTVEELVVDDSEVEEFSLEEFELDELESFEAQFAGKFTVLLMMEFVVLSMIILVQPFADTSAAGNESVPHAPFGSTLKRGAPLMSPAIKLRQISKVVAEPAVGVKRSPSAHALWVPRRWYVTSQFAS